MQNKAQERFFEILKEKYEKKSYLRESKSEKYIDLPYYYIAKDIVDLIFANADYKTSTNRAFKTEFNENISNIINTITSNSFRGYSLTDLGDYDAIRFRKILDKLTNNISKVNLVDINEKALKEARTNLSSLDYKFNFINDTIQNVLGNLREESPKIILASDSIASNNYNNSFSPFDKGTIANAFFKSLNPGDYAIFEFHVDGLDESNYSNDVSPYNWDFVKDNGILDVLGGTLNLETTENNRLTYIEGMKQKVNYKGYEFDFSPVNTAVSNDADSRIYICDSKSYEDFEINQLLFNFMFSKNLPVYFKKSGKEALLVVEKSQNSLWGDLRRINEDLAENVRANLEYNWHNPPEVKNGENYNYWKDINYKYYKNFLEGGPIYAWTARDSIKKEIVKVFGEDLFIKKDFSLL